MTTKRTMDPSKPSSERRELARLVRRIQTLTLELQKPRPAPARPAPRRPRARRALPALRAARDRRHRQSFLCRRGRRRTRRRRGRDRICPHHTTSRYRPAHRASTASQAAVPARRADGMAMTGRDSRRGRWIATVSRITTSKHGGTTRRHATSYVKEVAMKTESNTQVHRWRAFAVLAVAYYKPIIDLTIGNIALPICSAGDGSSCWGWPSSRRRRSAPGSR